MVEDHSDEPTRIAIGDSGGSIKKTGMVTHSGFYCMKRNVLRDFVSFQ